MLIRQGVEFLAVEAFNLATQILTYLDLSTCFCRTSSRNEASDIGFKLCQSGAKVVIDKFMHFICIIL